jgi:hypothetical protein
MAHPSDHSPQGSFSIGASTPALVQSADWDASTFTDMTITNDGDVVITVGIERTSGDDGSELMLIIA